MEHDGNLIIAMANIYASAYAAGFKEASSYEEARNNAKKAVDHFLESYEALIHQLTK